MHTRTQAHILSNKQEKVGREGDWKKREAGGRVGLERAVCFSLYPTFSVVAQHALFCFSSCQWKKQGTVCLCLDQIEREGCRRGGWVIPSLTTPTTCGIQPNNSTITTDVKQCQRTYSVDRREIIFYVQ